MSNLNWEEFIEKVVPENEEWSANADKYIELYPGSKVDVTGKLSYTLGVKGNVHAITAGIVGSGKSVFVNNVIATVTRMYSPKDLRLWLLDCKGTEFMIFEKSEKFPYTLPHIDVCETIMDNEFSSTIFDKLRLEAERRYQMLKDAGFKNTKEYNEYLRANGRESETIPRIMFICDEYQALFKCAAPDVLERVNYAITIIMKIGRVTGVHLFFASQSNSKSLSSDIFEHFALRFVLRSSKEVSEEFIGSDEAANIEEKFGYLYVKDGTSKIPTKFRTPYISDDSLREHIRKMSDKAKESNV